MKEYYTTEHHNATLIKLDGAIISPQEIVRRINVVMEHNAMFKELLGISELKATQLALELREIQSAPKNNASIVDYERPCSFCHRPYETCKCGVYWNKLRKEIGI